MNNQKYWERRKAQQMYEYMDEAEKVSAELEKSYKQASLYIQKEAQKIFEKLQSKYDLTRVEAELLLKNKKTPEDIESLRRLLQEDKKNAELLKEYESQAYKARIDRLSNLYAQLDSIVLPMIAAERRKNILLYEKLAEESYYQSIFDMQQFSGYGFDFKALDKKTIQKVLDTRWSGKNFSQAIWDNTHALAESVKKEILINLLTGRPLREAQQAIDNEFGKGYNKVRRLVRTESAYVCNQIQRESYKACGVDKYIFVAILDLKTSMICRGLDKKDFPVSKAAVGVNYPPMHPWCRSTTIAYISKDILAKMKQSAIDPATGKRITVPGDMTYKEWYKKYVEGKEAVIAKQKAVTNKSYDKDQHTRYREVLGDYMPETFEKFSEIKYNNKEEYSKLKHAYRIANQYEHNSGNMDPMKIVELHDEAVRNKSLLTGNARKQGNIGIMDLDGELYYASSKIGDKSSAWYNNFKGDKTRLVVSPEKETFEWKTINHPRNVDSEFKLFEFAAQIVKDGKPHKLELLSEKAMCKSCRGVMEQFKRRYPNVDVTATSHKTEKAEKHNNHNYTFEYDVKTEYSQNEKQK